MLQHQPKFKKYILRNWNSLPRSNKLNEILECLCPFCNSARIGWICNSPHQHFYAMYNLRPVLPDHIMIIPQKHVSKFSDLFCDANAQQVAIDYSLFLNTMIETLKQKQKTESYNVIIQEGEFSGQSVQHLHTHIIPRTENDIAKEQEKIHATHQTTAMTNDDWYEHFKKEENNETRNLKPEERQSAAKAIREIYEQVLQRHQAKWVSK